MRFRYFIAFILAAFLVSCEETPREEAQEINDFQFEDTRMADDSDILTRFAANALLSVQLSALATEQSDNPEVKAFATTMMADHQKIYDSLIVSTARFDIVLPAELSDQQQEMINTLKSKEGKAFDIAYLNAVVDYHSTLEGGMESMIQKTNHDSLVDFARMVDSHIYIHQNEAKTMLMEIDS
jgi:putative membrane protein